MRDEVLALVMGDGDRVKKTFVHAGFSRGKARPGNVLPDSAVVLRVVTP